MSNTPSKAEIESLVKRHGATSYRNRADTQHPAYGFTEDGLNGLIDEVLAKWGTQPQAGAVPQGWKAVPVNPTPEMWKAAKSVPDPNPPYTPHYGLVWDAMLAASPTPTPTPTAEQTFITPETGNSASAKGAAITSESGTPPAEQQATKETSGGFHVWRDISTAPKDGSRFVATGHNYGLYSEGRHICVAQWFRGCWMEASDWNEASELAYLTHWMPLPSPPDDVAAPTEQQAAPKAVPGVGNSGFDHKTAADFLNGKTVSDEAVRKFVAASRWAHDEKASLSAMLISVRGVLTSREAEIALLKKALLEAEAAPQQEAQEPSKAYAWVYVNKYGVESIPASKYWCTAMVSRHGGSMFPLYTAPQPAPLSECLRLLNSFEYEGDEDSQAKAFFKAHINEDWFFHVKNSLELALAAQGGSDATMG